MDEKSEWDNLQPEHLRLMSDAGYGGLGSGFEKLDQALKKSRPEEALPYLKEIIEGKADLEIMRDGGLDSSICRAIDWLVSLCLRNVFDDELKSESITLLIKVVNDNLEKGWNQEREHALVGLAKLAALEPSGITAINYLCELTSRPGLSTLQRLEVLLALAKTGSPKAISPLAQGVIESGSPALVEAMKKLTRVSWKAKAQTFIDLIKNSSLRNRDVKSQAVVNALCPYLEEQDDTSHRLAEIGDLFIEAARNQDERVAGVLAILLNATEDGDQILAGHRITQYTVAHKVPEEELVNLRIALGGTSALSGLTEVLRSDLEIYFQKPIYQLNEDTRKSWEKAVNSAHTGLKMRLFMSGTVFCIGILLLMISSWQMMFGNCTNALTPNTVLPFCAGLGTMLLIIYSGPIKEVRQAVNDLATTNTAFIGYVHRILEINHTFSFYYLKHEINFDLTEKSSQIIDEAMTHTIKAFERRAIDSSEGTIIKALKLIFKRPTCGNTNGDASSENSQKKSGGT